MSPADAAPPLGGCTVVVTRAREQVSALVIALTASGAHVVEVPTIAIEPADDGGAALRAALGNSRDYEWIVVTSANGARAVADASGPTESLRTARFAVVGASTADALRERGLDAALVPDRFVAEGLLDVFPAPSGRRRLLLAQADAARPVLAQGLRERGWQVDAVVAYRTVPATVDDAGRDAIAAAEAVLFTSASTVRNLVAAVGRDAIPSTVVTIGPVTTAAAERLGLSVAAEADPHTIDGLVAALVGTLGGSS